jgi:hypothetical protein
VDGAGNVHAVWRRKTSATADVANVIVRRYGAAAGAWEPEVVLGEVPMLKAWHPWSRWLTTAGRLLHFTSWISPEPRT